MYSLPLSLENRRKELQKIEALAAVKGYPKQIIDKVNEKHAKKHELSLVTTLTPFITATEARRVSFTFYPKVTNQLQRILRKYNLSVVY
jgi:endo-1,4-beta-D-glucanase Y